MQFELRPVQASFLFQLVDLEQALNLLFFDQFDPAHSLVAAGHLPMLVEKFEFLLLRPQFLSVLVFLSLINDFSHYQPLAFPAHFHTVLPFFDRSLQKN